LEILLNQCLRRVVPRSEILVFGKKKIVIIEIGRSLRHIYKGLLWCL
jgi:hypothetical protein